MLLNCIRTKKKYFFSNRIIGLLLGGVFLCAIPKVAFSQEKSASETKISSQDLVKKAWEASFKKDMIGLDDIVGQCDDLYGDEAHFLQEDMTAFPVKGTEEEYQVLNDVATCFFIRAEALMNTGKTEEAVKEFQNIIKKYKWAQAWDPRGWYWSIVEKSQASIDILTGKYEEDAQEKFEKVNRTKPILHTVGTEQVIDYTKYGKFIDVGTSRYSYKIEDLEGLVKALGEGVYPNTSSIYNNPRYKIARKEGRLTGKHWDYVNTDDLEAAYFKWVTAPEPQGVRLFYTGMIFEKAGMYHEALKAYYALIVHFPKTVSLTNWQTPWYPAQAAIAKIRHILRIHPELGLDTKWMKIQVLNGFDNITENDEIITYPGRIVKKGLLSKVKDKLDFKEKIPLGKISKQIGDGEVRLVQYDNGHWQMLVNGQPYIIKGITYTPTKIGQSPDKGTLENWMEEDINGNGKVDGPYDSWVDKNNNNEQDADEPVVGDFQLLKEMGANTIRIYHDPEKLNKELMREMYEKYGIRVIIGDFLGKYAKGSGATWFEGTDYENEEHKKNMLESVKKMVLEHKDEPYVLLWLLGNENNYGVASNADKKPEAYFKFVDEVAQWIKSRDKNHPVAICNGDTLYLDLFGKYCPNVDIFSANVYRGNYGFGSFWEQVYDASQKPAFITEYGCPAFAPHLSLEEAEIAQADYHMGNWLDIEENTAGNARGVGNSIGGVAFQWMDEWWKNYEPYKHDRKSDAVGPFPGGFYFEEWFGLISQGVGKHSPYMRQLRKGYYVYKELWNK